ncbi:lipid droplet-associated hydrolase [Atheta coriaria]|uniref:lipid droplet-associated hydrolase n=1 Tax=Dalotia coriaria TaxID=877792 RepID=UPI0031F3F2FC
MRAAFVKINQVPTRVACWGKWIEESFSEDDCKDIVLMIAGNPGITGYYEQFLQTIHQETGYNVWALSHAGHEDPQSERIMKMPRLEGNSDLYNLKGQIAHKIAFVKQYVPSDARVHILGHSIGAYMCTNMLDDPRIHKAYLLFPTIERMADSPNGRFYVRFVQRIQTILLILSYLFSLLPQIIRNLVGVVILYLGGFDRAFLQPMLTLSSPSVARKVMFLADDEMASVRQRNDALIKAHQDKIVGYYGQTDGWTPIKYYEDIRRDIPGVQVQLASKEFEHAYVLKHSREVAMVISDLIRAN